MCGISALYRHTVVTDSDIVKLQAMNQEMHYRGPDDSGIWNDDTCALAQVRLSIIGLEKGKQPLFNEDKSLVLICNGEIYNYLELKAELNRKGHQFMSESDSETILHLYEDYGVNCLEHLRGMFAFCLWDIKKGNLFVARDRIGEKPLYFSQLPTGVVVSSELKAILNQFVDNPQINLEQLAAPIRFTAPTHRVDTFIEQIKRVEPGHYLLISGSGVERHQYWKRNHKLKYEGTYSEALRETQRLIRESVELNLRSDVPVAVMLSGGIDSSAIAILARESGREVHTITAGYKGSHDCDEREVAKRLAKEKGFVYHEIELDESDFQNCFDELTAHIDEPVTDSAAIAQWALYKKVKDLGFKVLLGGMGGDELFYGYPYWNSFAESMRKREEFSNLFPWIGIDKKINYLNFFIKNFQYILKAGYPYKIEDNTVCFWNQKGYDKFRDTCTFNLLEWDYSMMDVYPYYHFKKEGNPNTIDSVYQFAFENIMTMAYLYLSDRLGMGNSLEIRSPLLDYKLVEFVNSLPETIKFQKDNPKGYFKDVLRGIVPDYILFADKKGFSPPPDFVKRIVDDYNYTFFSAEYKFYNSVLADRLLTRLFN